MLLLTKAPTSYSFLLFIPNFFILYQELSKISHYINSHVTLDISLLWQFVTLSLLLIALTIFNWAFCRIFLSWFCLPFVSWLDWGYMFGEEKHTKKCHFHHLTSYWMYWLSLCLIIYINLDCLVWNHFCQISPLWSYFSPSFSIPSYGRKTLKSPHLESREIYSCP